MKPILLLTDMFYSVFQADVFVAITMGLSLFPSDGFIISYLSIYVNKNLTILGKIINDIIHHSFFTFFVFQLSEFLVFLTIYMAPYMPYFAIHTSCSDVFILSFLQIPFASPYSLPLHSSII